MSTPSAEQQLLDQIQHYPDVEYVDTNIHAHRCYTIRHDECLYYADIDPFDHGSRRLTTTRSVMSFGCMDVPPVTHAQLAQLTSAVPIADIEALFEPTSLSISNAMCACCDDDDALFLYAVFVTNMRAYRPAESAPRAYKCTYRLPEANSAEVITEQLFWFGSIMNYAQLIIKNPVYAYCDTRVLSIDDNYPVVDWTGTYHIPRRMRSLRWACRHVPLGKQTVFNARCRVPCYGQCDEVQDVVLMNCACASNGIWYRVNNPIVSWMIEHGIVFYMCGSKCISVCEECYYLEPCMRIRAGEKYTCFDISCSYYWQYCVLTAFGPAEHARYVQVCKMIYG